MITYHDYNFIMGTIIGTLNEKSLHADLKKRYTQPGDGQEKKVDGYIIDIVTENELIEIQSRNFSNIKSKIYNLCANHRFRLVHPISREKWIVRVDREGKEVGRRKSPRRGRVQHVFKELRYIPDIPANPNFSLEVILIHSEEYWLDDGKGSWRRKGWSIVDQKLVSIYQNFVFQSVADYSAMIPNSLGLQWSNRDLAKSLKLNLKITQNMTYCLRVMGAIEKVGKTGNAFLYSVIS